MKFIKFQMFLASILAICILSIRIKITKDLPENPLSNDLTKLSQRNAEVETTSQTVESQPTISEPSTNIEKTPISNTQTKLTEAHLLNTKNAECKKPPKVEIVDELSRPMHNMESAPEKSSGGSFNFNVLIGNSNATISNNNLKGGY
jgi:hypothetical protein